MERNLREICSEVRKEKRITIQKIIEETGIPEGTVKNFFAASSREPNVYNAGSICAVLGVSLDEYFGIEPNITPEAEMRKMEQAHQSEIKIARLEGGMDQLSRSVNRQAQREKKQHRLLLLLSLICAALLCVVVWYISFDYNIQSSGLIRSGELGPVAWVVLILVAAGAGVIASALIYALNQAKKWEYN